MNSNKEVNKSNNRKNYLKRYRIINREKHKLIQENSRLKKDYGITLEEKIILINKQNNTCKICKTSFKEINSKQIHLDHDYKTGKIRGILCHHCNFLIENSKENINILKNTINYLENNNDL